MHASFYIPRRNRTKKLLYELVIALLTPSVFAAPFGNSADEDLAREVWNLLTQKGWAGPDFAVSQPYTGATPHGETLDTIDGVISLQENRLRPSNDG